MAGTGDDHELARSQERNQLGGVPSAAWGRSSQLTRLDRGDLPGIKSVKHIVTIRRTSRVSVASIVISCMASTQLRSQQTTWTVAQKTATSRVRMRRRIIGRVRQDRASRLYPRCRLCSAELRHTVVNSAARATAAVDARCRDSAAQHTEEDT